MNRVRPSIRIDKRMPSRLGVVWFALASVVVIWDAFFVLLRPRSMPGGDLQQFWKPYELYTWVDKRYGDLEDTFGIAQAWCNLVEVCFNLVTATLLLMRSRSALLTGFFVSALTWWKTVIYMIQYTWLCNAAHLVAHLDWKQYLFLFIVPNGIWIVVPAWFLLSYGCQLHSIIKTHKDKQN